MKKINELSSLQMKTVKGGKGISNATFHVDTPDGGGSGSYGHCFIDGETIFECMCTNDSQCQNVYGSGAKCWV